MSGRVLSVFFTPFAEDLASLAAKIEGFLAAQAAEAAPPDDPTGWCTLTPEPGGGWAPHQPRPQDAGAWRDLLARAAGAMWEGTARLRGVDLAVRIELFGQGSYTGLMATFGTLLHRQLYPDLGATGCAEEPASALVAFCLELCRATDGEAFLTATNDEGDRYVLDAETLRQGVTEPDFLDHAPYPYEELRLAGWRARLVDRAPVAAAWGPRASEVVKQTPDGFVLLNLL